MIEVLTPPQRRMLAFINAFRAREQCNPTVVEIAQHFGWQSANAAHEQILRMVRSGVLRHRPGRARGYIVNHPYLDIR